MKKVVVSGVILAVTAWMVWSGETAGVLMSNELPDRVVDEMENAGLEEGETVAAFTEFSLGSLSDYAVITNRRLMHTKDGRTTSIRHEDIASIDLGDAMIGGDLIVLDQEGQILRLQLANDPELFVRVLKEQKKQAEPNTDTSTSSVQADVAGQR